ncbi:MAG: hypothetical protein WA775_16375 [Psychroserpens sp.]|uniref:FKBP-type peptidyl-prolyl cis-trans isomerase n=1 Tax=Psychroserpens sp. TaxID=2020870 RepID=UPI003C765BC0
MNLKNSLIVLSVIVLCMTSCKSDDDVTFIPVPAADRTEQQVIDNDSLVGYLETHYFNAAQLNTPGVDYTIDDIVITELPQDLDGNFLALPNPDQNTLLIDAVVEYSSVYLNVVYKYYVLTVNLGGGDANPNFSDLIDIVYSGNTQDGVVFDNVVNPDEPLDLLRLIEGWRDVMPRFKTASSFTINGDGTIKYNDYGLGVMFLPSGLGYYANPPPLSDIGLYSNLIFKFELYRTQENDHDLDGVLSQDEDLNDNFNVFDDDTDGDTIPNYFDADDDGDGVFTLFEDIDEDGDPTNDDTDGDGIPNYLDADSTESNQDE